MKKVLAIIVIIYVFFPIFVQAEDILLEKNTAVLKATGGNVWVQVFSAEETAYMGTLEGGETTTVTFDDNLVVWTGKAENLEFIVNGKDMGSAGTGVMKNIMITAQGIEFKSSELDFFNSPQNVNGAWDNGHIKVLRLTDASSVDFSFYIFVFSEEGIWEYIDKIHLEWQRYEEPEVVFFSNTIFYSKIQVAGGSGALYYVYRFYSVQSDGVDQILEIPAEGHVAGWGMHFNRDFSSFITKEKDGLNVKYDIEVLANTGYFEPLYENVHTEKNSVFSLFKCTRQATYELSTSEVAFVLERSNIAEEKLELLYNGVGKDYYEMFKEEFNELADGNPEEKEWYEVFTGRILKTKDFIERTKKLNKKEVLKKSSDTFNK